MKRLGLTVLAFVTCTALAFAHPRPTLGALPFTDAHGSEGDTISRLISGQRYLRDTFDVVVRNMALSSIFVEREFQLRHLTDPRTMVNISEMLNANYILSGNTVRLGGRNLLLASIVHTESFRLVAGYYVIFDDIADIIYLAPSIARNLARMAKRQRAVMGVPSLAVIPFRHGPEVSMRYVETLAKIQAIEMVNTGKYIVLPRLPIITSALLEQGFQQRGYTDRAGWAELGRAMNAELVLGGSITRFGVASMFMSEILNVETGGLVAAENVQYQTIAEGIGLMGELAILLTSAPGIQRDRHLLEFQIRQGRHIHIPGNTVADQFAWLRNNAESNGNYLIELRGSITLAPQRLALPAGRNNVTVTLRGAYTMHTVRLTNNGSLFSVGYGITLVLDNNITLQGRNENTGPLVEVRNGGSLVMNEGSIIRGNAVSRRITNTAGGVRINNGGAFTMNGGRITGNTGSEGNNGMINMRHVGAWGTVGGVLNGGVFSMYGGTVSGNTGGRGGNGSNNNRTFFREIIVSAGDGGRGGTGGVQNYGTFIHRGGSVIDNIGGAAGRGGVTRNNIRGNNGVQGTGDVLNIVPGGVIIR